MRTALVAVTLFVVSGCATHLPPTQPAITLPSGLKDPFSQHQYCFNGVIVRPPLYMQFPPKSQVYQELADYAHDNALLWIMTQPKILPTKNCCQFGHGAYVVITLAPGPGDDWHIDLAEIAYDVLEDPYSSVVHRIPYPTPGLSLAAPLNKLLSQLPPTL